MGAILEGYRLRQCAIICGALLIAAVAGSCNRFERKSKERLIAIDEVIPGATVVSDVDGIIEYRGVMFYLGTDHLLKKKAIIDSLKLYDLENQTEVDMRFSRQIIIRRKQ